jgi:hypothetical protein
MNKIQGVSLPRSGHNLLVGHLQRYFGSNECCRVDRAPLFVTARRWLNRSRRDRQAQASAFHYCEYYYACRQSPCRAPNNHFQKSHDFDLDLSVQLDAQYLIQIRNLTSLLISWFELRLCKGREVDSHEGWIQFVNRNRGYVFGFLDKWLDAAKQQTVLVIDYDRYLAEPVATLSEVIRRFDPERACDESKLRRIIRNVRPATPACQFRYYESTPVDILARRAA